MEAYEIRALLAQYQCLQAVRRQMHRRRHNMADLARWMKKPQHQVEAWFQPYYQLTVRQLAQFELYCYATLFTVNETAEPWLQPDDKDLPF